MTRPYVTTHSQWMREMERRDRMMRARAVVYKRLQEEIQEAAEAGNGDQRVPAAPVEITASPGVMYYDRTGRRRGSMNLNWADVTKATDATDMLIAGYEVWMRRAGPDGTEIPTLKFALTDTTETSDSIIDDLDPSRWYEFRVRAISRTSSQPGQWSASVIERVTFDLEPPPMPSAPTVTVNLATHLVRWDGEADGGVDMPPDFAYAELAWGPTPEPTTVMGVLMSGPVTFANGNAPYDEPVYYRLRAVDYAGNYSDWSPVVSAVSTPLVSQDISDLDQWFAENDMSIAGTKASWDAAIETAAEVHATSDEEIKTALGKTSVVYSATPPAGDPDVAWVNTAMEPDQAYVWTGAAWEASDNAFAAQAIARYQAADLAVYEAEERYNQAVDEATISLEGAFDQMTYSPLPPSGEGTSEGHTWFQRDGSGTVIAQWRWDGSAWVSVEVGSEVIANLDVGKLTASAAEIDTLVAQKIAAASGQFIDLVAENFSANLITADFINIGSLTASTAFITAVQAMGVVIVDEEGSVVINLTGQGDVDTRGIFLKDGNGKGSASMSAASGAIYGREVSAEAIELAGEDLTDLLDSMPRGAVAWGEQACGGRRAEMNTTTNAQIELMELSVDVIEGRTYMIHVQPFGVYCGQDGIVRLYCSYTSDGSRPTRTDPKLGSGPLSIYRSRSTSPTSLFNMTGFIPHTPSSTREDRYLFWLEGNTSNAQSAMAVFDSTNGGMVRVQVIDYGRRDFTDNIGVNRAAIQSAVSGENSSPTPPPAKKRYTRTITASSHRTFLDTGAHDTGSQGSANPMTGDSPYTSGGSRRAQILFPAYSIPAGAVMKKVEVYLYAEHWHYNSGGSVGLRYSGDTSLRSTLTDAYITDRPAIGQNNFGKPQGRWITLGSSNFANVKAGNFRSLLLYAPSFSSSASYYGYFSNASDGSRAPKIRVTYDA